MRHALVIPTLLLAFACGARASLEPLPTASSGGAQAGGGRSSGGAPSKGGAPSSGGAPGSGGAPTCFETVQSGEGYCMKVSLCEEFQLETLCRRGELTVNCTCFKDGRAVHTRAFQLNEVRDLCALAQNFRCPVM